jgi:predicted O-methyltransferase YrrM
MSDFCNPETVTDLLAYLKDEGLTQEAMALFAKEVPALLNLVNSTPEGESARFARLTLAQAEAAEQARIELLKNEDGDIDESYGEGPYSEEMKFWMGNRYCSLLNSQTAAKVLVADAAEEVFTLGRLTYSLNPDFYGIVNSTFAKLPGLNVLEVVTGLGQHLQIVRDEAKPFDMYFIVGATKVGK